MRVHTDLIGNTAAIREMLKAEKAAGRIAPHVTFKVLSIHGSRIRDHAFEVQLEAGERDSGRRAGNSGSYGAMRPEYDGYAATYDEWGWLLAAMYKEDPDALVGSPQYPAYRDSQDFSEKTGMTYFPLTLIDRLRKGEDPYPYTNGYTANRVGRRGNGRIAADEAEENIRRGWTRHQKYAPRTVESVMHLARLDATDVL